MVVWRISEPKYKCLSRVLKRKFKLSGSFFFGAWEKFSIKVYVKMPIHGLLNWLKYIILTRVAFWHSRRCTLIPNVHVQHSKTLFLAQKLSFIVRADSFHFILITSIKRVPAQHSHAFVYRVLSTHTKRTVGVFLIFLNSLKNHLIFQLWTTWFHLYFQVYYFRQGHELYVKEVIALKSYEINPKKQCFYKLRLKVGYLSLLYHVQRG